MPTKPTKKTDTPALLRVTGQSKKVSGRPGANKSVSGPVKAVKSDIRGSRGTRTGVPKEGEMNVHNPTLENVTAEVDTLWAARVPHATAVTQYNKQLQPLIYQAWKLLFAGHKGRPKAGEASFTGWLKERGIPHKTGYRILDREKAERGEVIVSVTQLNGPEEEDADDVEGLAVKREGTVEGLADEDEADTPPAVKAAPSGTQKRVNLKSMTPTERTRAKEALIAELKTFIKSEAEVQEILDTAIITTLEMQLHGLRKKPPMSAAAKATMEKLAVKGSWVAA